MVKSRPISTARKSSHVDRRKSKCTSNLDVYTNRCNPFVIERMLHSGFQKLQQDLPKQIAATQTSIRSLETKLASKQRHANTKQAKKNVSALTEQFALQSQLSSLHSRLRHLQTREVQTWQEKMMQLRATQTNDVERLVIANQLLQRRHEMFYYESDVCTKCGSVYAYDHVTSFNICRHCGYICKVFFVAEDLSQDTLVAKDPLSAGNKSLNKQQKVHTYMRSPLYKRFLRQFLDTAPPIPIEVFRVLYRYMSNVHLQTSIRCRPTPISNILRNHGYAKWANHALLVTKRFNGDPVPQLSADLIERLVRRFNLIFHVAVKSKQRHRIPCFEFITHVLLCVEGRPDLARSFSLHKNKAVLLNSIKNLKGLLPQLKDVADHDDLSWELFPSF